MTAHVNLAEVLSAVGIAGGGYAGILSYIHGRRDKRKAAEREQAANAAKLELHDAIRSGVEAAVGGLRSELEKRFDANDAATRQAAQAVTEVKEKVIRIEAQFGPNGGGMREKLNTVSTQLHDHMEQAKQDRQRYDAAILSIAQNQPPVKGGA